MAAEGEDEPPAGLLRAERYGEGLTVHAGLEGLELGAFLHRCFEVLGSRPDLAGRLPELTGVELSASDIVTIRRAVERFEEWVAATFAVEAVLREWPLLAVDDQGSVVSGTADLVIRTPGGVWILDHKSDRIDEPGAGVQRYRPQIRAYARALAAQGEHVVGTGINWIRRGEVCLEPVAPAG